MGRQGTMPDALIMGGVKNSDPACAMLRPGQQEGVAHDFFIATF